MTYFILYTLCFLTGIGLSYLYFSRKLNYWNKSLSDFIQKLKSDPKNSSNFISEMMLPDSLQIPAREISSFIDHNTNQNSQNQSGQGEQKSLEFKKKLDNIQIINELGEKITSSLVLQETFEHLHLTLNSMMDAAIVELGVYDQSNKFWTIYSNEGNSNSVDYSNHMAEWVQENNRELILEDAEDHFGRYVSKPLQTQNKQIAKSIMAFPILFHNQVEGVISVISSRKNAYDSYHQESIQSLLGFLSVALENAHTHEQLNVLKIRAEESEKHEQQFLANMSHEIRTPMNAVLGMTNLLLDTKIDQKQLKYLNAINVSSKNLLVIINDILDLSKLEAGKMEIEKIPFRIKDVLDNISDTSKFKAEEKGLKFEVEIMPGLPEVVKGDPTRLNQIITNLCSNAVKFTEKGGVSIVVDKAEDNRFVRFKVKDTGIGIPEDKIHLLFSNFKQVDSSTFRKYGGTGLGLSISKTLIELQGGRVNVKSDINIGSVFTVEIPYEVGTQEEVEALEGDKSIDYTGLDGIRVLVAEDNEYNQIVVEDTLVGLISNVKIDIAENGLIAIEMMKKNSYDVVLMDAQMPEMDGLEATKQIRQFEDEVKNKIPILALTASVHRADIDRCIESGMNDFIPKPFTTQELLGSISKFYNNPKAISKPDEKEKPIVEEVVELENKPIKNTITNLNFLQKFTNGDPARMQKYIGLYLKLLPDNLVKMKAAIEEKDLQTIVKISHSMRPHLNYMGMSEAADIASKMEGNVMENKDLDKVVDMAVSVVESCVKSETELNEYLNSMN